MIDSKAWAGLPATQERRLAFMLPVASCVSLLSRHHDEVMRIDVLADIRARCQTVSLTAALRAFKAVLPCPPGSPGYLEGETCSSYLDQ